MAHDARHTRHRLPSLTSARDSAVDPGSPGGSFDLDAVPSFQQPYRMGGDGAGTFNQPIPAGVPTDRDSRAVVSDMLASMGRTRVALTDSDGVPGMYTASSGDPWYTVVADGHTLRWQIPDSATPGGQRGSDAPLVVRDPVHPDFGDDVELRLWHTHIDRVARRVTADGFGVFSTSRDSDGRPIVGYGTGAGLPWAGLIRAWEVRDGSINHALRFAAPVSHDFRLPALKSDQGRSGPLEMGMRLQLDPSVDCGARTVPARSPSGPETRMLRMVCRALQRYGAIAVDGSGDRDLYTFMMELGTRYGGTGDWRGVAGSPPSGFWGNLIRDRRADGTDGIRRSSTDGIPWERMRVLSTSVFPS